MLAAVLCPGPSLLRYQGDYELVIGVNRAATAFHCDVWVACDWSLVQRVRDEIKGNPILFTNSMSARRIARDGPMWPRRVERFEELNDADGDPISPTSFSSLAAVWYAVANGATTIRVYGADMSGKLDFDKVLAGETRTDARWERERELWQAMTEKLAKKNIVVARSI
jgi:hypothetical protein